MRVLMVAAPMPGHVLPLVPLAAALQEKSKLAGKRVGLVLSGGNIDFDLFKRWVMPA